MAHKNCSNRSQLVSLHSIISCVFLFFSMQGVCLQRFSEEQDIKHPMNANLFGNHCGEGGVLKYEQSCFLMFPRWACCSERIIQLESLEPS